MPGRGMVTQNCPNCGKVFMQLRESVCRECAEEENAAYARVAEYVGGHPFNALQEVAEATNVEERRLLRWLREGRLETRR